MPIDFSAWLNPSDAPTDIITFDDGKPKPWIKNYKPNNFVEHVGGLQDKILNVLRTNFPMQLEMSNARVTADKPKDYYTQAEFGGLAGNVIKAGKLTGNTYQNVEVGTGKKDANQDLSYTGEGKTTDGVFTMLHEIYHSRANGVARYNQKLGPDWRDMLKDAVKAGFPSTNKGWAGGDNLEELLASAVSIQDMQSKNMKFDKDSKYLYLPKELDNLKEKYSWMQDWLDTYQRPELLADIKKP